MKAGSGKQKGSAFERAVCKDLSLWVSKGNDENVFWRSAMSGGRATVQNKRGVTNKSQSGDISAVSEEGYPYTDKYYFECKFYKTLNVKSLVYNKQLKNSILDFWCTNLIKAKEVNKELILIAKENNNPTLFCVQKNSKLWSLLYDTYKIHALGIYPLSISPYEGVVVYDFNTVIEFVDSKILL
jgi:hypothetical protein